jgi:hypothetical protein
MISTLLRFILACLFLPCMLAAAEAQGVSFPELGDAVPGHQDISYFDLARMVVPDLASGENGGYKGSSPIEMRHILGADEGGSPPATLSVPDPAVLDIKAGGKDRLVMLIDLDQAEDSAEGFTVLALYNLAGKPRLLDAVNVAVDRSTDFRDPDKLSLGPGDDAIITTSSHFNSNQGYAGTALILVRNGRFELIDMIYTFDENYCAYRRTQDIAFKTLAGGRQALRRHQGHGDRCHQAERRKLRRGSAQGSLARYFRYLSLAESHVEICGEFQRLRAFGSRERQTLLNQRHSFARCKSAR